MLTIKTLVVVGGGILQARTFEETKRQGLKTLLIDGDEHCYCRSLADYFIHNSTKRLGSNVEDVSDFFKNNPDLSPIGVYTQGTDVEVTVSAIAEGMNLPSIGFDVALHCNNKIAMREEFQKVGIPQPKFSVGSVNNLSYPIVVKPVDNCASRGLTIVKDTLHLEKSIIHALHNSDDQRVLLEEFIDGKEYSVDTIVYKGRVYPAGISDRIFEAKDEYAIQKGSLTPSLLPEETQKRIYELMQECAEVIGIEWGAFKGDLIIRDNVIYVLEVTARLSGGFDAQFRKPYSFGVNLIKATIDLACGKPLDFYDIIPKWFKYSATFTVFPKEGIIKEIRGEEELRNMEGIKQVFITKRVGELIEYKNCADRVIHITACRDSNKELHETIHKARETIQFITK